MKITVIATGKCKDKAILALCADYLKRLKAPYNLRLIEVAQGRGEGQLLKQQEAERQLAKVPPGAALIALDEHGEIPTSRGLSQKLTHYQQNGVRDMVFLIGGADGLADDVLKQADWTFSLSKLTFPHMLVRPILLEQLYRAHTIQVRHPYHRD